MGCPDLTSQMFIAQFPEFNNNDNIEMMIDRALNYIEIHFCHLRPKQKQYVVFLLTAHLLCQQDAINKGETAGGLQTGASIDKISVSVAPAPYSDNFDYWLSLSKYGLELLAFLNTIPATPGYVPGTKARIL